ncbi:hypothetical protein FACS189494_10430 [Spirochaetia bacterium]|nr:hypothetical protein FACS189494_10430 [Spirochaetia bacterium]
MLVLKDLPAKRRGALLAGFLIAAAACFTAAGCATANLSSQDKIDNRAGHLTSVDIENFCDKMVTALLESERIRHYIISHENKEHKMPSIGVQEFQNKSDEDFDFAPVGEMLKKRLVKSEYFIIGNNGTAKGGAAIAGDAEIFTSGEVRTIVEKIKGLKKRTFYISVRIINHDRNRVLWKYETSIQKEIKNEITFWDRIGSLFTTE